MGQRRRFGRVIARGELPVISRGRRVRFKRLTRCAGDYWIEVGSVGTIASVLPELWVDMEDECGVGRVRLQRGVDANEVFEIMVTEPPPPPPSLREIELHVTRCMSSCPPA